jgi:hypothetical protein
LIHLLFKATIFKNKYSNKIWNISEPANTLDSIDLQYFKH